MAAAVSWLVVRGLRAKWREGAVTYSAYAPAWRGNHGMPNTSSPGWKRVTPKPVSSTTPETSQPSTNGGSPSTAAMPEPWRVFQSTGLTPAACTRTKISVGRGTGRGTSARRSTSGPPKVS
ncbi:hypothetical protein GCM10020001_096940 [Nonomuraea salmonea]